MFTCQLPSCSKQFKPQVKHDNTHDTYTVTCPHCHSVHVATQKNWHPSGTAEFKFKLEA